MLFSLVQWLATTRISLAMHDLKLFSLVDTLHQLGMVLFLGCITVMSLRLLGVLMPRRPISEVTRDLRHGTIAGLATMFVTGPLVAVAEPERWYTDGPFRLKMAILLAALIFHFTLFRRVTQRDEPGPLLSRCTGVLALLLWFGVGWMGRLITVL
jgi:hypothetical protein